GARPLEVALPAREPLEYVAHRRQPAPVEELRVAAVDVQPAAHAVGELLGYPRPVFGLGRRGEAPPRIEIAHRHPARPVGREPRQVFRLDAGPPRRRVPPLAFEGEDILMRHPVIDVPPARPRGFERLEELHGGYEYRVPAGCVDRPVHALPPRGDAPVAPLVVAAPHRVRPVFARYVGARVLMEEAAAGVAVAVAGFPGGELPLIVPDPVGV